MPQVPTLQQSISSRAAPNIEVRPLQSTVAQDIGQGVANVGRALFEVRQQEQRKADQVAYMEAENNTSTVSNDLLSQAQSVRLKDAIGVTPKLLSTFDEKANEIEGGLKNDRQKMAYRQARYQQRQSLERTLNSHENQQRQAYEDQTRDSYMTQRHMDAVTNYKNPVRIEREIDNIRATLDQVPGIDADMRANELASKRTAIYQGVIQRYLAVDDVKGAEAYFGSVRDKVNGDKLPLIENALHDARARVDAAAKSAAITAQAGRVLTLYQSAGPDAGSAALSALSKKLPPDVMGEVYSKVNSFLGQQRSAKQEEHADELASVYQSISAGTAGPDQIASVEKLWNDNAFTPTERASLIGRIEASQVQHAGSQAAAGAVRDALNKGLPLDPSNGEQRKALSSAFSEDARGAAVGTPQWQGLAVAYAARTRVVPEQATSWVRSAIRSPDYKVAGPAAQFLGSVQASAPDAVSGFDADTKAFAGMVNSMVEAGTAPEKAVEVARQNVFDVKPAVRDQRKELYRAASKDSNSALDTLIDRDMDTWLTSQPAPTTALQADFNSQTEKYYLRTGDLETARELAWTDLKRVYGQSEVNGVKQVMAAPPERFGIKPEDVRGDISAFLNAHPQSDGSKPDEIVLVPDALTMRATVDLLDGKAVSPSYKLVTKSGDLVLDDKGVPVRYSLPTGEDLATRIKAEQDKAETEARAKVDAAREEREQRRKAAQLRLEHPELLVR
jgi:hypothetical protein